MVRNVLSYKSSIMVNTTTLLSTLITANHILHYHNVLDAMGHVSVRNPNTNTTFFIALQLGQKATFLAFSTMPIDPPLDLSSLTSTRPRPHLRTPRHRRIPNRRRQPLRRNKRRLRRTLHPQRSPKAIPGRQCRSAQSLRGRTTLHSNFKPKLTIRASIPHGRLPRPVCA